MLRRLIPLVVVACAATGCTIPSDPDHTLDTVRSSHVLRAGASPAEGLVDVSGGKVAGSEAALVEKFAEQLGAKVEWTVAGEQHLVQALEEGELDLAVGGLTDDTPWGSKAGMTRAYREDQGPDGKKRKHVMFTPLGENAFTSELELFLDKEAGRG